MITSDVEQGIGFSTKQEGDLGRALSPPHQMYLPAEVLLTSRMLIVLGNEPK